MYHNTSSQHTPLFIFLRQKKSTKLVYRFPVECWRLVLAHPSIPRPPVHAHPGPEKEVILKKKERVR